MPAPLNPNLWAVVLHDEDGIPISPSNPLPISASLDIQQVQHIETVAPLTAGGSFTGADRDCEDYESFGISVYVASDTPGVAINAIVTVENSVDGTTWRVVDEITLTGPTPTAPDLATPIALNRVYSVCRQFYRVSIENNDGSNGLSVTEVISMLKPI